MSDSDHNYPRLRRSREETRREFEKLIAEGDEIINEPINDDPELQLINDKFYMWSVRVDAALLRHFTTDQKAVQFRSQILIWNNYPDLKRTVEQFRHNNSQYLTTLKAITGALEYCDEDVTTDAIPPPKKTFTKDVGDGDVSSKAILTTRHIPPITGRDRWWLGGILGITFTVAFAICQEFALRSWIGAIIASIALIIVFVIIVWQITHFRKFTHWIEHKLSTRTKHHGR